MIFFAIIALYGVSLVPVHGLNQTDEILLQKLTERITQAIQKKPSLKTKLLNQLSFINTKISATHSKYDLIQWLQKNIADFPHLKRDIPEPNYSAYFVDGDILKANWLKYYNDYRASDGLPWFITDSRLENTAREWSNIMHKRWEISHERNIGDGWYNYPIIEQWFQDRWVKCRVSWRTTSVENTGYHSYYCPDGWNCTEKASTALKQIFDFYAAEKWLPYPQNAHYKTIVSPYLQYMGLWLSFKDEWNGWIQIYTTTHFCTEFK